MRPDGSSQQPPADVDTLIVGRVIATHGVRGELRVEPLTDNPARFSSLAYVLVGGREHVVESVRSHSAGLLLKLRGLDDPGSAGRLKGEYLSVRAADAAPLPEGAYYHYQLLGLQVHTTAGDPLGELVDVLPLSANDIYVVRGERGEVLLPAIKDVVKEIDLSAGRLVVEPVPGLLPWEEQGT